MTNAEGMMKQAYSSFGIRHSAFRAAGASAFTVVELLIVMAIILILAGLILATSSYVQKKGARSHAEAEIAAMSAALENYKADNGIYPRSPDTDLINAKAGTTPSSTTPDEYTKSSLYLYKMLTGDADANRTIDATETGKSYFQFKPNQLGPTDQSSAVIMIRDPFANSYGYSTAYQANSAKGYNPTFDLWSTANETDSSRWIKNW
jgi:type II secretory pathway pseudopilin PulG